MIYLALLRGINVGGNRMVDMLKLKAVFKDAGMEEVQTYINSGNVIFRSESLDPSHLRFLLESVIKETFGFPVKVILRDADNITKLVRALPEGWVNGPDFKCNVMFLSDEVCSPTILNQLTIKAEIDRVEYFPGAILWRTERSGAGRSGMMKLIGTSLYSLMTIRNCNTVRRLGEIILDRTGVK